MRLVIALGGNALLKRGEPMLCENQRENVSLACKQIAKAYEGNELVITHGNGPQVGLLALQNNAYKKVPMYPLDVIGAESVGMIGYMIQQELVNYVPRRPPRSRRSSRRRRLTLKIPPSRTRRSPSAPSTTRKRPNSSPSSTAGRSLPTTTSGAAWFRARIRSASGVSLLLRPWLKTATSSSAAAAVFRRTSTRTASSSAPKP